MSATENAAANRETTAAANSFLAHKSLPALVPLLWEIANLKRIKPANLNGTSFAENLFRRAWSEIAAGKSLREVALKTTAEVVAAAELGAIDRRVLRRAELSGEDINTILWRSFDSSASLLDAELREELRARLFEDSEIELINVPPFVEKLAAQPRSGATKPGAARLVFDQPENHAEHCIAVAVFAVLLAPHFGATVETAFLAGLAHHFHNADLPDSGFAGEELLDEFLPVIFQNLRAQCLRELPENLHQQIWQIFREIERAETAEAKTFHAADVLDRVLQMRHHAQTNEFTLEYALDDMELVHAGAVQTFHYEILRATKLIETTNEHR